MVKPPPFKRTTQGSSPWRGTFINMKIKVCRKCGDPKPIDDFHKCAKNKDGKHSYCKKCSVLGATAWYVDNKGDPELASRLQKYGKKQTVIRSIINAFKASKKCVNCPEDDPCCLDFHHLENKKDTVSEMIERKNLRKIVAEINKCVLVCANCHRKLHAGHLVLVPDTAPVVLDYSDFLNALLARREEFTTGQRILKCNVPNTPG